MLTGRFHARLFWDVPSGLNQEDRETGIQEDILGNHEGLGGRQKGWARGNEGQPRGAAPTRMSLGDVVLRFKTLTTKRYIDGVKQNRWPAFDGKLWQRNYYEHIIHGDRPLRKIRKYIADNPMAWQMDQLNPQFYGVRMDEIAAIKNSIMDMEDD